MPAIQPDRLKQQAADLSLNFSDGDLFLRALDALLGLYAERAVRPGQTGEPSALLDKYGVPPPVLRYILLAIGPYAQNDPTSALVLCDRLWQEPNLEYRTLAIGLLGKIPAVESSRVIELAEKWAQQESHRRLVLDIFETGLAAVRKAHSEQMLEMAQAWLQDPDLEKQKLGLMALYPLATDLDFENVPIFFKFLTPIAVRINSELRPEFLDIILALGQRSPRETAYFIQELLQLPGCLAGGWLARQLLPILPEDVAASLRRTLHSASSQPTRPITPRE